MRGKVPGKLNRFVQWAFAPQVSSSYSFALLFLFYGGSPIYLTLAVLFSSIIPVAALLVYARASNGDANADDLTGRSMLFAIGIASYLAGFLVLWYASAPYLMAVLMLCYAVNASVAAVITKYATKVSIHVWGLSGPSVVILYAFGPAAFAGMLAMAALVGASRVGMGKHTPTQVALSFAVSVPVTALVVYLIGFALL